ncbi:MAG: hypothetical protein Q4F00_10930 [bacterium]|nr:hypothetical protein [bacterium]
MLSGLVYPLWLLLSPIVLYGSKKNEPYLYFNALQAIALGVSSLAGSLLVFLLTCFLMWLLPQSYLAVSAIMGMVIFSVVLLAVLFYLTLILFIAWRVANGKFLRLPFIGAWAEKKMQHDLNITPESYSTAIFGEKRSNIKLSNFDYRSAPGYVEDNYSEETDEEVAYYNPDTGTYEYEYNPEEASPAALLSYEDANAPQSREKSNVAPVASRPGGFQPQAPRASAASRPGSKDGFNPLSVANFGNKMPGGSSNNLGSYKATSQFKPLTPQAAVNSAPAPVVAGQRPAPSQFKPLTPQAAVNSAPAPVVAGQRSAPSQFKPLTPQSNSTSSPSGQSAPKFQWSKDFGHSSSASGTSIPDRIPLINAPADSEDSSFKPGLISSNKSLRSEAPRFQWDQLGEK